MNSIEKSRTSPLSNLHLLGREGSDQSGVWYAHDSRWDCVLGRARDREECCLCGIVSPFDTAVKPNLACVLSAFFTRLYHEPVFSFVYFSCSHRIDTTPSLPPFFSSLQSYKLSCLQFSPTTNHLFPGKGSSPRVAAQPGH